jgi:hypothetical protein
MLLSRQQNIGENHRGTLEGTRLATAYVLHVYIIMCKLVHMTKLRVLVGMIGFISSWVTHSLYITFTTGSTAIAQFTVAHVLGLLCAHKPFPSN